MMSVYLLWELHSYRISRKNMWIFCKIVMHFITNETGPYRFNWLSWIIFRSLYVINLCKFNSNQTFPNYVLPRFGINSFIQYFSCFVFINQFTLLFSSQNINYWIRNCFRLRYRACMRECVWGVPYVLIFVYC